MVIPFTWTVLAVGVSAGIVSSDKAELVEDESIASLLFETEGGKEVAMRPFHGDFEGVSGVSCCDMKAIEIVMLVGYQGLDYRPKIPW